MSRCKWLNGLSAALQVITGAVIVGVEVEIIHQEMPQTLGFVSLIHKEVTIKGQ